MTIEQRSLPDKEAADDVKIRREPMPLWMIELLQEMAELDIRTAHSTGRQEAKLAIAGNMLREKHEHAAIARWTGLSPDEIKKLAAELDEG